MADAKFTVTITATSSGFSEMEYQDLGHPEALEDALLAKDHLEALEAKILHHTAQSPLLIGTTWLDGLDGPSNAKAIGMEASEIYAQAQQIDPWPDSYVTPQQVAAALGVPLESLPPDWAATSTEATPTGLAVGVPPPDSLFDPEPVDTSSHLWCALHRVHWDFHPADANPYCAGGGWFRTTTVAEEKDRATKIKTGWFPA